MCSQYGLKSQILSNTGVISTQEGKSFIFFTSGMDEYTLQTAVKKHPAVLH